MPQERRRSYRYPVQDGQQEAALRVLDTEMPVRLIDHSSTGFSVQLSQHPGCYPGEVVWLKTVGGWNSVRVVKVRQHPDGTRIGLQRIEDSTSANQSRSQRVEELQERFERQAKFSARTKWLIAGMSMAFTGVVICLVWTVIIQRAGGELDVVQILLGDTSPVDARPAAVQALEVEQLRHQSELRKAIASAGPVVINMPDVADRLRLSSSQQEQVDEIIRHTSEAEGKIPRNTAHTEIERQRLHRSALEQALELLTPEQLADWHALVHESLQKIE